MSADKDAAPADEVVDRGDLAEPAVVVPTEPVITPADEEIILGKDAPAAEEEPVVEGKGEKADDADKSDIAVPKARFDESRRLAREREETLAAENRALKEQLEANKFTATVEETDAKILELTKAHAKHLSDGELDKAAEVFAEIRTLDRQIAQEQAKQITERARTEAREDSKMDALVSKFEIDHPFLNPENEKEYNADAVEEVLFLRRSFEQQGLSRTQALSKAVQYVVKSIAPATDVPKQGIGEVDDRAKLATAKKLAAAKAQAPIMGDLGSPSDKAGGGFDASSVMQMTQDEFSKLPEREMARMRGDEM